MAASASAQLVTDGGTAVIDAVTNTIGGNLIVGTNAGNTTLILTNGSRINNVGGMIGQNSGSSDNLVQVIGSVWSNSLFLTVGNAGTRNALLVTNGGAVFCTFLRVGSAIFGHSNRLHIAGLGSVCIASSLVAVGNGGSGNELKIENGGQLRQIDPGSDEGVQIGSNPSATNNLIHVRGGSLITAFPLFVGGDPSGGSFGNNRLIIEGGGTVTNDFGMLGVRQGGSNNLVMVTGPGSVWHNQNRLTVGQEGNGHSLVISNSALVRTDHGFLIGSNGNRNSIVVDGGLLSVEGDGSDFFRVGESGSENQLIVTNGGRVEWSATLTPTVGRASGSNNLLLVSGPGSVWLSTNTSGNMAVGFDAHNSRLIIENGGQAVFPGARISTGTGSNNSVIVRNPGSLLSANLLISGVGNRGDLSISNGAHVIVGGPFTSGLNHPCSLTVSAANLTVTNAGVTGLLNVVRGTNLFDGGTILTDQLQLTNGAGVFHFHRGTLQSRTTLVNNGLPFVVGDGVNTAVFQLPAGTHTFNNGLVLSSNALLQGCGTINGGVIVQPGGTVLSDCTNLVFTSTVTNHGILRALNGSTLRVQGLIVNNGVIDVIEGTTNLLGGFINNGIVLTPADVRISEVSVSSYDVSVKLPSFVGHTFQLQRRDSLAIGSWTNLGAAQAGTGGILTLTDPGSMTNAPERFYRVRLVP